MPHEETPHTHSQPQPQPQPQRTPTASNNLEHPTSDEPHQPPQPPPQLPQPQHQPPHPQHEDIIDISSSSEDESQPPPPKMIIPKTEEETLPTEEAQPPPSQTVVEVVNIYPTQEVIDLSSSSEEDRQQPIVPKEEQDVDTSPSPRSQMISDVLVSIRRDNPPMEPPSFDLGVEPPLLTPQTMDAINEIDDQLQKNPNLLRTPDPMGTSHILADMERRVAIWGTVPKGDNEWLPVLKLKGDKPLDALRYQFKSMQPTKYVDIQVVSIMCHLLNMTPGERYQNLIYCVPPELLQRIFDKYEHKWKDPKSRKPHEISTLLNINEYLGYMENDRLQTSVCSRSVLRTLVDVCSGSGEEASLCIGLEKRAVPYTRKN
ncbi:hypothetical protein PIB30_018627 [Stylosanthes scabra]|uniref:Uncharacterized protein n=1 Tax=Stylosanthes scabra TaxID=79078 RepID=A0ABU6T8C1_9FABA|nr:hypothetical protein [Stylosanthes scabra]